LRHENLSPYTATPLGGLLSSTDLLVASSPLRPGVSIELPRGTQRALMNASAFAAHIGRPINALVTINARDLQCLSTSGVFPSSPLKRVLKDLLELMRKWLGARGVTWIAVWSREWSRERGEHWHIGLHLPAKHHADFAAQIAIWTGEDHDVDRVLDDAEIAVSRDNSWQIKKHLRSKESREYKDAIAAYLGKAEPSRITLHGKKKTNPDKERPRLYGGAGPIDGKRSGVSRSLDINAQRKAGFTAPYAGRQQPTDSKAGAGMARGRKTATERHTGVLSKSTAARKRTGTRNASQPTTGALCAPDYGSGAGA